MDTHTLIKDLTETQILSAVRARFTGELVEDLNIQMLINQSHTLGDLYAAIQEAIDRRNSGQPPAGK